MRRRIHLADRNLRESPLNRPPKIVQENGEPWFDFTGCPERVLIYAAGLGKTEAPLDDPSWHVWALNLVAPMDSEDRLRCDLWFDLHQRVAQTDDDMRWIRKCPVPIVVPDDLADVSPNAIEFPLYRVLTTFPVAPFACTFAYQMALALLAEFDTIGLYGVELAYGSERERTVEWACVNWWIGYAEAMGIEILRPQNTRLGRHPYLYGIDYQAEIESTKAYLGLMERVTADQ